MIKQSTPIKPSQRTAQRIGRLCGQWYSGMDALYVITCNWSFGRITPVTAKYIRQARFLLSKEIDSETIAISNQLVQFAKRLGIDLDNDDRDSE